MDNSFLNNITTTETSSTIIATDTLQVKVNDKDVDIDKNSSTFNTQDSGRPLSPLINSFNPSGKLNFSEETFGKGLKIEEDFRTERIRSQNSTFSKSELKPFQKIDNSKNLPTRDIQSEDVNSINNSDQTNSDLSLVPKHSTFKPDFAKSEEFTQQSLQESTPNILLKRSSDAGKNDYLERKKLKLKHKEKKIERKKMKFNITTKHSPNLDDENENPTSTDTSYQLEYIKPNSDILLSNPHMETQTSSYDPPVSIPSIGMLLRTSENLERTTPYSIRVSTSTTSPYTEKLTEDSKPPTPQPLSRIMPSLEEEKEQIESSTTGSISLKRYTTTRTTMNKRTTDSVLYQGQGSNISVCSDDPCGAGVACHPTGKGFLCFCSDGTEVAPREPCPDIRPVNVTPPAVSMPHATESLMKPSQIIILVAVITMAIVVIGVIGLFIFRRRSLCKIMRQRTSLKFNKSDSDSVIKISTLHTYNFASNPNYYTSSPDQLPLQALSVQLISKDQINFIGELGEGCFGRVYKGEYFPKEESDQYDEETSSRSSGASISSSEEDNEDDKDSTKEEKKKKWGKKARKKTVAVKVLKELVGMEAEAEFMREVEIMATFRHQNILSLVGVVVEDTGGTPWMIFEFMPYGDLAEVLRSCCKQYGNTCPPVKTLDKMELLNICIQVAAGMEYLSLQHFVHRDLACRNCLVGKNLTVKISDFGMSRDVYTCDYYKVGGSRMLPVRWMAPESILYGKFTLESDVWSFGVVLWEIYSFGKQPYYGNSNEEVVQLILQGILLSPSESCPPLVREVMRLCWSTEAHNRLTFKDIVQRLKHAQQVLEEDILCQEIFSQVNYSHLSLQETAVKLETDSDLYLLPKKNVVTDEYLTVLGSA